MNMARKPSINTIAKLIDRLNSELRFDIRLSKVEVLTYNGSQDADAHRWFTMGIYPEIHSSVTISDILKAKDISYIYKSFENGADGGVWIYDEPFLKNEATRFSTKPNFIYR